MILIVDDSPESRFATRRALHRAGYETLEAETGPEGLETARRELPELVVLDVNLPGMDGFEVCRALKNDPLTAHVPVLQASAARIDTAARVAGLEAGADAFLVEPIDPAVLVATVKALLRLSAAEDRLRQQVRDGETIRQLTAALADALTATEVVSVLATQVLTELGAQAFRLYVADGRGKLVQRDDGDAQAPDPDVAEAARSGIAVFDSPVAIAPLVAYGRSQGALVVTFPADRSFDEDARELLIAIGERCGQALERASLYEQQRHIATTLQERLLPAALPELPGVTIGVRYASGTRDMQVGGDFYDVFPRGDDWIAVIGDVCGRGAEAAALTSLARHTIRAHAEHLDSPSEILLRLDRAAQDELKGQRESFLTAACARLRAEGDTMRLTLAVAGHPSPLIAHPDGTVEPIRPHGPLLGMLAGIEIDDVETVLEPGDALVLYTDGVTEAPVNDGQFGEERLRSVISAARDGHGQAIADAILAATGTQGDDIAVLVIALSADRRPSGGGAPAMVAPAAAPAL